MHPGQVDAANEVYAPTQEDYDRTELVLDAYDYATRVQRRGADWRGNEELDKTFPARWRWSSRPRDARPV